MKKLIISMIIFWLFQIESGSAKDILLTKIAFISENEMRKPVLSNLEETPLNIALSGAEVALKDNKTTGRFLSQDYTLNYDHLDTTEQIISRLDELYQQGFHYFVMDLQAKTLLDVLSNAPKDILLFNARAKENNLRLEVCDHRLLHTMPSYAMLTDALTQFMVLKRWKDWFMISGAEYEDQLFATSLKESAQKFGAKIVEDKIWDGARDARRSAQNEVPLLTQGEDYDVLMVADIKGDFGEYLPYQTYDPRPVAGTQGLFSSAWYWTAEQWGAAQLQSRFEKHTSRHMQERDYATWAAVRTIGEAVVRTGKNDVASINKYIRSGEFELAGFKGRKLTYREWNGQLRQPIILTHARSVVAQAPLAGFLHQFNELDTLGYDKPQVKCQP